MKKLNLALQGGGAHGAFTWGVLDRLLREEDIEIEGVTATSAGAMNGAMLTTGIKSGGREEARARLRTFWRAIRDAHPLNQPPFSFWNGIAPLLGADPNAAYHPAYMMGDLVSRTVSPYQFNPLGVNPLRDTLERMIDFDMICRTIDPRLYVSATDVMSGRAKVFSGDDITVDAILASACLPYLFQAVEIDGRAYWDGGYTGNPPIWPLIYNSESRDVLVVHINPITRDTVPTEARAIQNRVDEIAFNSNLMNEMRAIDTVSRMIDRGALDGERYRKMRIHAVEDADTMSELGFASKLNPEWGMLKRLRDAGRAAMDAWLVAHKETIGVDSTVDVREKYL